VKKKKDRCRRVRWLPTCESLSAVCTLAALFTICTTASHNSTQYLCCLSPPLSPSYLLHASLSLYCT
jgi:hypothetical protein